MQVMLASLGQRRFKALKDRYLGVGKQAQEMEGYGSKKDGRRLRLYLDEKALN
jgi:hypothetical protein